MKSTTVCFECSWIPLLPFADVHLSTGGVGGGRILSKSPENKKSQSVIYHLKSLTKNILQKSELYNIGSRVAIYYVIHNFLAGI